MQNGKYCIVSIVVTIERLMHSLTTQCSCIFSLSCLRSHPSDAGNIRNPITPSLLYKLEKLFAEVIDFNADGTCPSLSPLGWYLGPQLTNQSVSLHLSEGDGRRVCLGIWK